MATMRRVRVKKMSSSSKKIIGLARSSGIRLRWSPGHGDMTRVHWVTARSIGYAPGYAAALKAALAALDRPQHDLGLCTEKKSF
jgi:hypothetical protein